MFKLKNLKHINNHTTKHESIKKNKLLFCQTEVGLQADIGDSIGDRIYI